MNTLYITHMVSINYKMLTEAADQHGKLKASWEMDLGREIITKVWINIWDKILKCI